MGGCRRLCAWVSSAEGALSTERSEWLERRLAAMHGERGAAWSVSATFNKLTAAAASPGATPALGTGLWVVETSDVPGAVLATTGRLAARGAFEATAALGGTAELQPMLRKLQKTKAQAGAERAVLDGGTTTVTVAGTSWQLGDFSVRVGQLRWERLPRGVVLELEYAAAVAWAQGECEPVLSEFVQLLGGTAGWVAPIIVTDCAQLPKDVLGDDYGAEHLGVQYAQLLRRLEVELDKKI